MQTESMWPLLVIFMLALGAWMFIENLRSRPRRSAYRQDFRRMESPAARQRRHAAQRASGQHAPRRGFNAR